MDDKVAILRFFLELMEELREEVGEILHHAYTHTLRGNEQEEEEAGWITLNMNMKAPTH